MAEGDILLGWTRGNAKGEIYSPFELTEIESEQEPLGQVTLKGTRSGQIQTWAMGPDRWGIETRPGLPAPLLDLYRDGQKLAKDGKLSEATTAWRAAAKQSQKYSCTWLNAWFLFHAAETLKTAQDGKDALPLYREAVDVAARAHLEVRVKLMQALALAFYRQNDFANSEKSQREALATLAAAGHETLATATSLAGLGRLADARGNFEQAQSFFGHALTISQRLAPGQPGPVAQSLYSMAGVADERGDLDHAEKYNLQSMSIREKLAPDSLPVASSLNNLGNVAQDRGDLDKAESYYRSALEILHRLAPDSVVEVESLTSLGNIADDRGDLNEAEEYYSKALEMGKRIAPGSLGVAAGLNNLGLVENVVGNLVDAENHFRQALKIREGLAPGGMEVAESLNNLGNVEDDRGDLPAAEDFYSRALAIEKERAPDSDRPPTTLFNLGEDYLRSGNLNQAEQNFGQSLAAFKKLAPDSLQVAMVLAGLGEAARSRGDLAKAGDLFQESLNINKKVAPNSLDVATGLNNLAEVAHDRGDLVKSQDYYNQSLDIRRKFAPESAVYAETLGALAEIMRDQGQADRASQFYAQAIDVLESQIDRLGGLSDVRAEFRAKHADYYSEYSNLLAAQGKTELAFQVLERSRARSLLEMLAEAHLDVRNGVDPSLLEQLRALRISLATKSSRKIDLLQGEHNEERLRNLSKEIDETLSQYKDVERQIRTSSPAYAALTQPQPLTAAEVQQQLLDANTVLLEYSLGEKRSLVFLATPNSLDAFELPKRPLIESAAKRVYDLLTFRNRSVAGETFLQRKERLDKAGAEYRKAVSDLSQMILGPVVSRLGEKRLLIVADGALQYVPFAILPAASGSGSEAAPLIAEHEIVNLPSASVLALLQQQDNGRRVAPKEVAVLADPVFDSDDPRIREAAGMHPANVALNSSRSALSLPQHLTRSLGDVGLSGISLPRLLFSRREADAIMAVTDPGMGMEALDFAASRELALSNDLAQYRIVHFATHGLLDNEHPELSGLVLSLVNRKGKPQEGFLDLEDVYNLRLSAELVVLSACETGLGKQVNGEGLLGLTRGFMYAGASRVVASLWQVDDVATAELMGRFYQAMLKGGERGTGLPPAAALRKAQMEMRQQKQWADPYYWAAFTMQGEWK